MFLDAPSNGYQTATFTFGGDSYMRRFDICVSMHECGSESGKKLKSQHFFSEIHKYFCHNSQHACSILIKYHVKNGLSSVTHQ